MKDVKEFEDLTDFTSDKFLAINSCGFTKCTAKQTVLRSCGRKDWHIIYVLKGEYIVCLDEEKSFKEGSVIVFKPFEKQYYSFDKGTEAYWIHFTGTVAEELISKYEISSMNIGINSSAVESFNGIINNFEAGKDNFLSISYLIRMCAEINSFVLKKKTPDRRIEKIKRYMNENYKENHSIGFYASMCNLSTYRFSHLFKPETGFAPHSYILDIRMRQIKYLLTYSNMNISEIAEETGFTDALYMSRLFSKYNGVSPQQYRNQKNE